ncbi:MAG: tetratricopeptide repeat protein [Pedosphaera sp.]|nr:tetratricopeptide repeat protein [Pedosphaera sp.]
MSTNSGTPFYVTGGTLPADSPSYVERKADRDLLAALSRGDFCYILTSRQMGKSSLMVRTTETLRAAGHLVSVLDLTAIGQNLTPEQWYGGLATRLGRQLHLEDELEEFLHTHPNLGPCQRFFTGLREIILPRLKAPKPANPPNPSDTPPRLQLILFIDELDVVRSLPFRTDEFFAALRECHTRRLEDPEFHRLVFCLLGVATPSQLIQDVNTTPFNIGRRIELRDFTAKEAVGLAKGIESMLAATGTAVTEIQPIAAAMLERILYWTCGHPYLTQRLCWRTIDALVQSHSPTDTKVGGTAIIRLSPTVGAARFVDLLCQDLFLVERAREKDDNLHYVRDRLLRSEADRDAVLQLYQRIRRGEFFHDDETNPAINTLLLSGLVQVLNNRLFVRNPIYMAVFDDPWIRANLSEKVEEIRSLGILPFVNRCATPDEEYLGDGLSEDLIAALSKIQGLRVASRTSAFAFKGKNEDIRAIATQLGVNQVLEGSVRRVGSQLRITVQLISGADGAPVWSQQYDREWKDVFVVQDEITRSIASALKIQLLGETEFAGRGSVNPEAYQAYLRARHQLHQGSAIGLDEAVRQFEAALALDPEYALAWAGLAEVRLHQYFWNLAPKEVALKAAREAARKALELNEHLPDAHTALALVSGIIDWDWDAEERHLKRAIELNPNDATPQAYAAILMAMQRRFDPAVKAARRAIELDPLSPFVNHHYAAVLYFAGRYTKAEAALRRTLELEPNFFRSQAMFSNLCQDLGRHDEAIAAARKATAASPGPGLLATLGTALARAGRVTEAREILAQLEEISRSVPVAPTLFARIHMALANPAVALERLEQAVQQHCGDLDLIHLQPVFQPLHDEPRFRRIVEQLGLPLPLVPPPTLSVPAIPDTFIESVDTATRAVPPPGHLFRLRWILLAVALFLGALLSWVTWARLNEILNLFRN